MKSQRKRGGGKGRGGNNNPGKVSIPCPKGACNLPPSYEKAMRVDLPPSDDEEKPKKTAKNPKVGKKITNGETGKNIESLKKSEGKVEKGEKQKKVKAQEPPLSELNSCNPRNSKKKKRRRCLIFLGVRIKRREEKV